MVKLGQFLSLRIDLLPAVVTEELALLQDRMPSAPFSAIKAAVEADLAGPLARRFAWFSPHPLASASLAQVHAAHLYSGEPVVVKVLRPGVIEQVEMDLMVIRLIVRGLSQIGRLRKQFSLDTLLLEFIAVTRRELDLVSEGQNAERFRREFAANLQVYIPQVHWACSGSRTLTLENVSYLKINDVVAIKATGIDPAHVAHSLAEIYFRQIFVHHFVHADPHPGNVFVKPLPHPDEVDIADFGPKAPIPFKPNRPFQIVLIDFGMASEIPPQSQIWLREFIIGLGLRDAHRIVQSYLSGGLLQAGADVERIETMTADLLQGFQEMLIGFMPDLERTEGRQMFEKYQDMLYNYPFQIPGDLLFMYRALGIVGSLVKKLDPEFELSTAAAPLALQFLWQDWQKNWQDWLQELTRLGQLLATQPARLDQVLVQAQEVLKPPASVNRFLKPPWTRLNPKAGLEAKDRQILQDLQKSIQQQGWTRLAAGLFMGGVIWHVGMRLAAALAGDAASPDNFGLAVMGMAVVVFLWGLANHR